MRLWYLITWLGDSALLLPAAAFITVWLGIARSTRPAALRWLITFGICGGIVMASKVAFMGWGYGIRALDFIGFSGHTAIAALVWPVALWLIASRAGHRVRVAAACAGWALGALVGVSRLVIDVHSVSEVLSGYVIGSASSALFLYAQHRRPHPDLRAVLVGLSLLLPVLVFTPGRPAPTHKLLLVGSAWLAGHARPYTRNDLHAGTHPPPRVRRPVLGE